MIKIALELPDVVCRGMLKLRAGDTGAAADYSRSYFLHSVLPVGSAYAKGEPMENRRKKRVSRRRGVGQGPLVWVGAWDESGHWEHRERRRGLRERREVKIPLEMLDSASE
jgi:hypothetical protein